MQVPSQPSGVLWSRSHPPPPPPTKPEMFQPDVMVEDDKWCPLGKMGKVRPLLFDVTNGGWVSILA